MNPEFSFNAGGDPERGPSVDTASSYVSGDEQHTAAWDSRADASDSDEDGPMFADLQISRPILNATIKLGFKRPTPIQAKTIPVALLGRDILGSAVTGSGKTAAFTIPILERLQYRQRQISATRVVVLVPTRELAVQCRDMVTSLAEFTDLRVAVIVGGLSLKPQETELRTRPDFIIATPGRLVDHLRNAQSFSLDDVEILVLDEADRLLEMGFAEEVDYITRACTKESRQTLLFSATMTTEVQDLAKLSLRDPVSVSVNSPFQVAAGLEQEFVRIHDEKDREGTLLALCRNSLGMDVRPVNAEGEENSEGSGAADDLPSESKAQHSGGTPNRTTAIIFCAHKHTAHRIHQIFSLSGLRSVELHGDLSQAQRLTALNSFRAGGARILVATDLAARGLDIRNVSCIINFNAPKTLTNYVHRVGRTARAGEVGKSITFCGTRIHEKRLVRDVVAYASASKTASRVVAEDAVREWKARIEQMAPKLKQWNKDERVEKALLKADMEATKAQNMLMYEDEIHARPKRSWILSGQEKSALKKRSKEAALVDEARAEDSSGDEDATARSGPPNKRGRGRGRGCGRGRGRGRGRGTDDVSDALTGRGGKGAARRGRDFDKKEMGLQRSAKRKAKQRGRGRGK